jgi:FSR family fosmidomycin resistance protein-like MFS transporter
MSWLITILLVVGVSSAFYHVPAPVMIRRLSGDKIGSGMSLFMVGGELARTIGPLMIIAAIDIFGFEGSYPIMIPGILAAILLYFTVSDVKISGEVSGRGALRNISEAWNKNRRMFMMIFGIMSGRAFMLAALTLFLPTYMVEKGFSLWIAGISLSALELAGAAGALSSGFLSDRLGKKRVLITITAISPVFLFLFLITETYIAGTMLIVLGLALFAITPINLAIVQEREDDYPASANSIFMTLNFAATSVIALLFGALSDIISLEGTYYLSAALGLIAIPFAAFLPCGESTSKT